ncbi:D-alanyl-D-alanine carboxypeptidase [Planomicrobium sp. HSC-17F08]|nr:D-alanyl-D-alanine carboxypeptidase [Planomicrobium sp. HSC-17F08]
MKSRSPINPKNKKAYIKWASIAAAALGALVAVFWLYTEEKSTDPVNNNSATAPSQSQQPATSEDSPEEKAAKEEAAKEQEAKEKAAEEQAAKEKAAEEQAAKEKAAEEKAIKEQASKEAAEKKAAEEQASKEAAEEKAAEEKAAEQKAASGKKLDATQYAEDTALPSKPTIISGVLLANKQHPLPATYAPGEVKEARSAFESMRADALKAGIDLTAFSTYRGFDRQKELYAGYVAKDGQQAADRYSARPGYSEHQTGLAFDIGESGQEQHWASSSFGDTKGGKWLKDNAHNYGFILRYPKGAENITGYMHESWHYRYVGKKVATDIHSKGITLEEYLGVN